MSLLCQCLESTNSMAVNSHTTLSVLNLTLSPSDLSTDDKAKDPQNALSSRRKPFKAKLYKPPSVCQSTMTSI